MFCVNCGKVLEDDSKFCPYCGNVVKSAANVSNDIINDANTDAFTQSAVAFDESVNNTASFEVPVKKSKRKPILISILSVLVVVAIVVGITFPYISNFFRKTYSSPEEYYRSVENSSAENTVDGIISAISAYKKSIRSPKDSKTNISLSLYGKNVISGQLLFDADSQSYFISLPELSDKYLSISLPQIDYGNSQMAAFDTEQLDKLLDALPDDEKLEKLLYAYIDAVVGAVDNVTESSKTIEVEGISEDCAVLTVNLTNKDLLKISNTVLKKAENDKELKQILKDFVLAVDPTADADDIYDEFHDGILDALDDLDDIDDYDNAEYIKIKTYVNSKGDIIGRSIGNDEFTASYLMPSNNKDFGFKLELSNRSNSVLLVGKGIYDDGKIDGNLALKSNNINLINIKIVDFEPITDSNKYINGKIEISYSNEFASLLMNSGNLAMLDIEDLIVSVDLKTSKNESSVQFSIINGTEPLCAIIIENEAMDNKVSMPSSDECIDLDDLSDWLSTVDFNKLKNNLADAGIPSDVVGALIQSLQGAIWEYGSGFDYDDFDYDDFDYDDFDYDDFDYDDFDYDDFDYDDFGFDDFDYDAFGYNDFEIDQGVSEWM